MIDWPLFILGIIGWISQWVVEGAAFMLGMVLMLGLLGYTNE